MAVQQVAFIINPKSARGNHGEFLRKLNLFWENPLCCISQSKEETADFIQTHWERVNIFVAVGGDGTISSVAENLVHSEKILAVYPAGSGNGFAREAGFSKNLNQLLRKIKQRNFQRVDTLLVNDFFFVNMAGAGYVGTVVKEFEKTNRGFRNYIKVCLQTYFSFNPVTVTFVKDTHPEWSGDYLMVNIANTRQYGNNAFIAPHADFADGLATIVLVKKFPLWYAPIFAGRLFRKKLKDDRFVKSFHSADIQLSVTSSAWHTDGEFRHIESPVHIKVLPASLKILV